MYVYTYVYMCTKVTLKEGRIKNAEKLSTLHCCCSDLI